MNKIKIDKSIIIACDFDTIETLEKIVKETKNREKLGGFKLGFELGLKYGLPKCVETIRKYSNKTIIYDHQKSGTDVPFTGEKFAQVCKEAGVDYVIHFPQAGPETEKAWIKASQDAGLGVIIGGEMTHPGYLENEGGFLRDDAPRRMYEIAVEMGVTEFVVPGNKPEKIKMYREFFESKGIEPVLYSPGLVSQGGKISDSGEAAGKKWHAIVGRAVYQAENASNAIDELGKEL
ncbi:MAG: hypothetical protein COV47_05080 [Candidatus Diapherotrites archaeon CG11_big_fil_rev_8_21_14_0_20_37_9]|nr:MAG: hypothetical protein COV47_05080 [Candidatus Diapherotrites archaeon CG11_big_fil_rev_8_21_14_0_20_37_9]